MVQCRTSQVGTGQSWITAYDFQMLFVLFLFSVYSGATIRQVEANLKYEIQKSWLLVTLDDFSRPPCVSFRMNGFLVRIKLDVAWQSAKVSHYVWGVCACFVFMWKVSKFDMKKGWVRRSYFHPAVFLWKIYAPPPHQLFFINGRQEFHSPFLR